MCAVLGISFGYQMAEPTQVTNPAKVSNTHYYGTPLRDESREAHKFDYENNKWVYTDELEKSTTTKVCTVYIEKRSASEKAFDDRVEDYIQDNWEELKEYHDLH